MPTRHSHSLLRALDWFQIAVSVLMVALGTVILIRSLPLGFLLPALLLGGGFIIFGLYRLSFVVRYVQGRRGVP